MNHSAAWPVEEASQIGEARRAAITIAERLAFPESRTGQVGLVVSELATNLARHAKRGEILLRPIRHDDGDSGPEGVEILAIDAGPGMPDAVLSRRDGFSTAGTLGHGLGAIERQSDFFQLYTQPSGTVALARFWGSTGPPGRAPAALCHRRRARVEGRRGRLRGRLGLAHAGRSPRHHSSPMASGMDSRPTTRRARPSAHFIALTRNRRTVSFRMFTTRFAPHAGPRSRRWRSTWSAASGATAGSATSARSCSWRRDPATA